jgi:TRAP-type C4-dicarboxylate transport system permease small subunit
MTLFEKIWRGYGALLHALGIVAGLATLVMMVIVVANVIGRYLFNAPIPGAFEVSQSVLTVTIFLSLALTQFHDGHIKVVILTRLLPLRGRRWVAVLMLLVAASLFAIASYATLEFAWESYLVNEQERGSIQYPLWPVKFVVFAGLVLLCIQYLLSAARAVVVPDPDDIGETL